MNTDKNKNVTGPDLPYWPLWEHMSDTHGLILLDSECEDILQIPDQILTRRLDKNVASIEKNLRLIDTRLRLMTETLQQIAGGSRNTRDRRNARATLSFLESLIRNAASTSVAAERGGNSNHR